VVSYGDGAFEDQDKIKIERNTHEASAGRRPEAVVLCKAEKVLRQHKPEPDPRADRAIKIE
jgi:hypothetical protein